MGISEAELAVHRYNTAAFIMADVFMCTLIRRTRNPDGSGGYVFTAGTPLVPQAMRLIPQQDVMPERQLADGRVVTPTYVLQGLAGSNMAPFDLFTKDGRRYEVVFVAENQQYQKKAEVIYLG